MTKTITFFAAGGTEEPTGLKYVPLGQSFIKRGYQVNCIALHPNYAELVIKETNIGGMSICFVGQMHVLKKNSRKYYFSKLKLCWVVVCSTFGMIVKGLTVKTDVIYCLKPQPINGLSSWIVKIVRNKPYLLDCDDYEAELNRLSPFQKKVFVFFENFLPKIAQKVTVNTTFLLEHYTDLGCPREKFILFQFGIDKTRFASLNPQKVEFLRNKLSLEGKRVVLYFGTLSLKSGHAVDLLLKAWPVVKARIPDAVLLIVGGGEDFERLQEMTGSAIKDSVVFPGRVPPEDVPYFLKISEVSIDPVEDTLTNKGRSPWKIFESMAVGVPVITSDVGDRKYYLDNQTAGLLVRAGDYQDLAQGIIKLLTDQKLRLEMANKCLQLSKKYNWDETVDNLIGNIPCLREN